MAQLAEDGEDDYIANELEKMSRHYVFTGPCHECKLGKEINTHQVSVIRELKSNVASMERRL